MQFNLWDSSIEDQEMVRNDVKARKIGSTVSDLPVSSQPTDSQKRKAESSSSSQPLTGPSSSQVKEEDIDEYFDDSLDEAKDELYVSIKTNVVGLQYYTGKVLDSFMIVAFMSYVQAWLDLMKKCRLCGNRTTDSTPMLFKF